MGEPEVRFGEVSKHPRSLVAGLRRFANDSVLYHSLPGLASVRVQFVGYRDQPIGEFMSDSLRIWLELGCGVFP
jgi:hypothetical protein